VAQAVLGMMRLLAPDRERATLAVAATVIVLAIPSAWGQIGARSVPDTWVTVLEFTPW